MTAPRWTTALLRRVAPPDRVDDVLGDLEEAHAARVAQHGRFTATIHTSFEAIDMAFMLWRRRRAVSDGRRGGLFSVLDIKLGFRMLARYPGLTLVAGFALAFGIWGGAGTFEVLSQLIYPTLPFPNGDRVVAIRLWDDSTNRFESRILHDFDTWRQELRSIDHLGAYRTESRNLITGEGRGEPVEIAEITASAFTLAQVQPILGRVLVPDDERAAAPDVALIGERVWEERFAADPGIVGKPVRLGNAVHTVIGVMPASFGFPYRHAVWLPFRLNPLDYERRQGLGIEVFGQLPRGTSIEQAEIELASLVRRAAVDFPRTHAHLTARVASYPRLIDADDSWEVLSLNLIPIALLALISSNVALLMFARAAARESEIAVRAALGASRGRIIGQLFAEALVLGGIAAIVGVGAAQSGLGWAISAVETIEPVPFWIRPSLAPSTIVYAVGLTLTGAIVAGVLPAVKVTSGFGARLKQSSAGAGGLQFGGVWTAIIVIQVAATVVFPSVAFFVRGDAFQAELRVNIRDQDLAFPTGEYLSVKVEIDRDAGADSTVAAFRERFARAYTELERRLLADPAVTGVTFAGLLPGLYHPWHQVEIDDGAVPPPDSSLGHIASVTPVDIDYFKTLGMPVVAGRDFHSGDVAANTRVAIVNESFVQKTLGGRSALGRRVRWVRDENQRTYNENAPWFEIVGVVPDLGKTTGYGNSGVYLPSARGGTYPAYVAIHVRADPLSFAPRVRLTATAANPGLRLYELQPLDRVGDDDLRFLLFWFRLTTAVSFFALLLSLSGIYAVTSFTVSRKTREIGVRVALGATRWRLVLSIFRRPLIQLSLGIVVGAFAIAVLIGSAGAPDGGLAAPRHYGIIAMYAALMMLVCMLACFVPLRRALRIEPTQALREE